MTANRRAAPRYPSWLPGTVEVPGEPAPMPVRVVNLSLGGAALEADFTAVPGAVVELAIDWGDLGLLVSCVAVADDENAMLSVLRVRFDRLTDDQTLVVTALVGAMASEFHDQQVELFRPTRHRRSNVVAFRPRQP